MLIFNDIMKKLLVTLFSFDGRIRRKKYATYSIPALWISIILSIMTTLQGHYDWHPDDAMLFVTFIPLLGWVLPAIILLNNEKLVDLLHGFSSYSDDGYWPLFLLLYLTFFFLLGWVLLAQGAKRCHDLGRSGYRQLIPFYWFWILFKDGQHGSNRYGEDPKERSMEKQ